MRGFLGGLMSIKFSIFFILSILLLVVLSFGCEDTTTSPGGDVVFPDSNISYSQHVQPTFNLKCSLSGCHDDQTRAANLSLTSYLNATEEPGIVIPRDSQHSLLAQKIDGRLPHHIQVDLRLTQNQINGIKKWIDEGATYN
jgi:hypothetical protein